MRGLVGRVKDAAAAKVAASVAAARPGADGPSLVTAIGCGDQGKLGRALRRVTHSDCAKVPAEDVREVVLLACEGDGTLALVLQHIEENLCAPPGQWRRIHGALALLERMLRACPERPAPGGGSLASARAEDALVGRAWYEAKVLERLRALGRFEHPEDARVTLLVRRAATSAQEAAEQHLPDGDDEALSSGGDGGAAGGGGELAEGRAPRRPSPGRRGTPQRRPSPGHHGTPPRAEPRLLGRPFSPVPAAQATAQAARAARRLESASSALDALGDVGTKRAQPPPRPKAQPAAEALAEEPPAAGHCGCCCRRRSRPVPGYDGSPGAGSSPPRGPQRDDMSSTSDSTYDESGALLV